MADGPVYHFHPGTPDDAGGKGVMKWRIALGPSYVLVAEGAMRSRRDGLRLLELLTNETLHEAQRA